MLTKTGTDKFTLSLPRAFTFHRQFLDFDFVLKCFDWTLSNVEVVIDVTTCERANYQALCLLIQYAWALSARSCTVVFKYGLASSGPTQMLSRMGATNWFQVLTINGRDFGNRAAQTFALRRRSDVQNTINTTRRAVQNFKVGFPDYLSYIVSELLYNTTEHGWSSATVDHCQVAVPSVFQFGHYPNLGRLSFFVSDLGMGVKAHLEQAYKPFPTHQEAILEALRPNVSGTFGPSKGPYEVSNNAGMGLTYSSTMLKRLRGEMYVVSHGGLVHVSPDDITSRSLIHSWPGTFVLVTLNVSEAPTVSLAELIAEIRERSNVELAAMADAEEQTVFTLNVFNYFGKWAEDKDAAINLRDNRILPAIEAGKKIELDFRDVETAPHSFLNALLGTPISRLGVRAYQRIRIVNAPGPIHEILQTILETNVPGIQ